MRRIRDRHLPAPFAGWIDGRKPLGSDVTLLPRTINLALDLGMLIVLGTMFGGMGIFFLVVLPPRSFDPTESGSWIMYLILGGLCIAFFTVPLLLVTRAINTLRAWNEVRHGQLRQGVFAGPAGLLVRLEPNRCYAIPWDRFVEAKVFPPPESRDTRKQHTIIETRDGPVAFFTERWQAGPGDVHKYAKTFHPAWKKPKSPRKDRVHRQEPRSRKHFLTAALMFGGAMISVGLSLAANIYSPNSTGAALGLLASLILLGASIVTVFVVIFSLKLNYRCHQCGRRIARMYEALPAVHYYCPTCNIEWETGIEEHESDGS